MAKYTLSWVCLGATDFYSDKFIIAYFDAASDPDARAYCISRRIGTGCLVRPDGNITQITGADEETIVGDHRQGIHGIHSFDHSARIAPIEVLAQTAFNSKRREPLAAKIIGVVEGLRSLYAPYVEAGKAPAELFQGVIDRAEKMQLVQKDGDMLYCK